MRLTNQLGDLSLGLNGDSPTDPGEGGQGVSGDEVWYGRCAVCARVRASGLRPARCLHARCVSMALRCCMLTHAEHSRRRNAKCKARSRVNSARTHMHTYTNVYAHAHARAPTHTHIRRDGSSPR